MNVPQQTTTPPVCLPTTLAAMVLAMSEAHTGAAEEADAIGNAIIVAVAKGEIPHVSITY